MTKPALLRCLAVLTVFVGVGALAGWLWEVIWTPPMGVVFHDTWFLDPPGPDYAFSGTALYVLIGAGVGLLLGVAAAWRAGHELLTLATVLVGSALAGWVMFAVGHALGPPDPSVVAEGMDDYARLPGALVLAGAPAWLAVPVGALTGLTVVYLFGLGRAVGRMRRSAGRTDDARHRANGG